MAENCTVCKFDISTSWVVESENKDLKSTVTINITNKSVDLDDVVQLETCIHLIQDNEIKEPCTLSISIPETSSELITQLVVVSEARIVELFGSGDEYVSTCTAEYVDDFEDCAVYMAECQVKPTKQLLIKFQKAKHPDSIWLYGINLTVYQSKSCPPSSSINFQVVNDMLKDTKIPISENAEKCKTFLQAYCNTQNQNQPSFFKNKPPNPQLLMKMFEAEYFNPISEKGKNMSKCFSNLVPFFTRESPENNCTAESAVSQSKNGHSSELLFLKSYIDKRFTDLECKMEKFEQRMKELEVRQSEKLDCILALLNKQSS